MNVGVVTPRFSKRAHALGLPRSNPRGWKPIPCHGSDMGAPGCNVTHPGATPLPIDGISPIPEPGGCNIRIGCPPSRPRRIPPPSSVLRRGVWRSTSLGGRTGSLPRNSTEQTRNGVTWLAKVGAARSDRGGPLAPWPQITPVMIMVTNTFRIARRAIPGGISCRHKNAKCRVNGVGVKGRLVGTTGSCWVAGCSEGSMSWHVEITDADDTHKDGSVQVE